MKTIKVIISKKRIRILFISAVLLVLCACSGKNEKVLVTETEQISNTEYSNSESTDAILQDSKEKQQEELIASEDSSKEEDVTESSKGEGMQSQTKDEFLSLTDGLDTSVPFAMEEKAYQVYKGTIGDKKAILAIWMENQYAYTDCTFVVGEEEKETTGKASLIRKNVIGLKSDSVKFAFVTNESQELTGFCSLGGNTVEKMHFKLTSIHYTQDKDKRYTMGSNEAVEELAAKFKEAVAQKDAETLANYISFPLTMYVDGEKVTVPSKEEFVKIAPDKCFTNSFVEDMQNSFTKFMFSNDMGDMIGSERNNIWIYPDDTTEEENFIVTTINISN